MAKKKKVSIKTEKVDFDLERDGVNVNLNLDTENVDIKYIKDDVKNEFNLDSKNLDIDITKTEEGINVKVDAKTPFWRMVGKRIVKYITKKFSKKK